MQIRSRSANAFFCVSRVVHERWNSSWSYSKINSRKCVSESSAAVDSRMPHISLVKRRFALLLSLPKFPSASCLSIRKRDFLLLLADPAPTSKFKFENASSWYQISNKRTKPIVYVYIVLTRSVGRLLRCSGVNRAVNPTSIHEASVELSFHFAFDRNMNRSEFMFAFRFIHPCWPWESTVRKAALVNARSGLMFRANSEMFVPVSHTGCVDGREP